MRVPTNQRCEIRRLVLGNDSASIVAVVPAPAIATLPMLRSDHDLMSLIKDIKS